MTTVAEDLTSQGSSWVVSSLPDAIAVEETANDNTEILNPPANTCPGCGEEVVKIPGQRGRTPKYHPDCKPAKGSRSAGPRVVRVTSQERIAAEQVEYAVERVRSGLAKAVALLSIVDPYDAFVLHVNSSEIVDNMRPVLMRFPWLREQAGNASAGASLLSLGITLFTTVLPILAHHKLIPVKKFVPLLIQMPFFMKRMQDRMADQENGDPATELIARIRMEAEKENRRQARTAEETVNASAR